MLLNELFEAGNKHVAFCFGRLNPPTIGHKKLLDTVSGIGGDYKIFVSPSQDKKDNPLDYATKVMGVDTVSDELGKLSKRYTKQVMSGMGNFKL